MFSRKIMAGVAVAALTSIASPSGATPTLTVLAQFNSSSGGVPEGGVVFDSAGNLLGTLSEGGNGSGGTVYSLSSDHSRFTTVVPFSALTTGAGPFAGLATDSAGNLYGTTRYDGPGSQGLGYGTVFELSGPGHSTLSTLTTFPGTGPEGPAAPLLVDSAGNLYGTTLGGSGPGKYGTVFELSGPSHQTLSTLASFSGSAGLYPMAGLTMDAAGNLYGTTNSDATNLSGTVFELSGPNHGTFTTLAQFNTSGPSGPEGTLVMDAVGNLYGTTVHGGAHNDGTIFELSGVNHQTITTLHSFDATGGEPMAGLIIDAAGNFFGTTSAGGPAYGTVFELGADHQTFTTLANFDLTNGAHSLAGLTADSAGNLYGTTSAGGSSNGGTLFELSGTGYVASVPEPAVTGLLPLLAAGWFCRRRPGLCV